MSNSVNGLAIQEFSFISKLEKISDKHKECRKTVPFDVSHWDPSSVFEKVVGKVLQLPLSPKPFQYQLPYEINQDVRQNTLKKLGYEDSHGIEFTNSGTTAILAAINLLDILGIKKIILLSPHYFSAGHVCNRLKIQYEEIHLQQEDMRFKIPHITASKDVAIWITTPVYCTGIYFDEDEVAKLRKFMNLGAFVVADECLAKNGKELARRLGGEPNFIGIHAPHKAISINAVKFGAVSVRSELLIGISHWTDVLTGALSASTVQAIFHFNSKNFDEVSSEAFSFYQMAFDDLIAANSFSEYRIESTNAVEGQFFGIFIPQVSAELEKNFSFLEKVIFRSATTFIPCTRNHHSGQAGFGFRINLARHSTGFNFHVDALIRAILHENSLLPS